MTKLTRQAQVLIFAFLIVIFLIAGFLLLRPTAQEVKADDKKDEYSITLVAENQDIQSLYIDSISPEKSASKFEAYQVALKPGDKVGKYTLSENQTFSKYIKAVGPNGKDVLTKKVNDKITHYAYSLLLVGDIQEKTNLRTKEKTYSVVNARITYDQIPLILIGNENSVRLANQKKTKEKFVNLQDFINALKDVKKRDTMISW